MVGSMTSINSLWSNKTGFLQNCNCVSSTVWLHHLNSNKRLEEKARLELYKDATCYFEQILEAACYKTTSVWPITFHLTNYLRQIRHAATQLVMAVEYVDCIFAEQQNPNFNECPGYGTKPSDDEAPVLELWEMWSTHSLLLLPGPFWPGVVVPVWVK